jgi:hypothetical protein
MPPTKNKNKNAMRQMQGSKKFSDRAGVGKISSREKKTGGRSKIVTKLMQRVFAALDGGFNLGMNGMHTGSIPPPMRH